MQLQLLVSVVGLNLVLRVQSVGEILSAPQIRIAHQEAPDQAWLQKLEKLDKLLLPQLEWTEGGVSQKMPALLMEEARPGGPLLVLREGVWETSQPRIRIRDPRAW